MKTETAINMAVTAVVCDMRLPQVMKKEIIDGLTEAERLADIGKAVVAATFEGVAWVTDDSTGTCNYPSEEDVQSLVLWYRAMS